MKKENFYTLLLILIWPCYSEKPETSAISTNVVSAPYEATWMELTKVGNNYVVYNYPSLWDDMKTKSPTKMRVHGNQLNCVTFSDDPKLTYYFNTVERKDNDIYFFWIGESYNSFSFQWVDKGKHIAKWIVYYSYGVIADDNLYIDSLYNTFPIVDYKWND
jgi:hypothetical protein